MEKERERAIIITHVYICTNTRICTMLDIMQCFHVKNNLNKIFGIYLYEHRDIVHRVSLYIIFFRLLDITTRIKCNINLYR